MPICIITKRHSGWKFKELENGTTWIRYSTDINRMGNYWWDLGVIESSCQTVYNTLFPLFKPHSNYLRIRKKYFFTGRIVAFSYIPPLKDTKFNVYIHEEEMKDYINVKCENRIRWRKF